MRSLTTGAGLRMRHAAGITVLALTAALLGSAPAVAATERPAHAPASVPAVTQVAPDLRQPVDFANAVQARIYRMRQDMAEETPVGPSGFTHRLVGRGTTGTRNWGLLNVGHLAYEDDDNALQLVVDPDDLYIRGFYRRSENRLFHYEGTDIPDALFPAGVQRTELRFGENYLNLQGMTINRGAITGAVAALLGNNDLGETGEVRRALQVMFVTFAETARNRRINHEVYTALRGDGDWLVGAHADVMTSWNQMGGDIRAALADGDWTRTRGNYLLDGVHGGRLLGYHATYLLGITYLIKRR
ncbi:ribosome-inactivating family protein [Streptomyces sp. NPDC056831]|uniref:ribosome-inactivating family protein n=1 Tax=Streptomyces sp. NPDC056831 TaxID=3345954 RepID=UPI0036BA0B49